MQPPEQLPEEGITDLKKAETGSNVTVHTATLTSELISAQLLERLRQEDCNLRPCLRSNSPPKQLTLSAWQVRPVSCWLGPQLLR